MTVLYPSIIIGGLLCIALWGIADIASRLVVRVLVAIDKHDSQVAADHNEPSRAEVEAGYLDEDREAWFFGPRAAYGVASDTPIYDATAAHIAAHAVEEVDAEWAAIQREIGGVA